jgi:hypothetical protein
MMADSESFRRASGQINIQVNVEVEARLAQDADETRAAIQAAVNQKLEDLPTDLFSTLNDNSTISLIASVRPKRGPR